MEKVHRVRAKSGGVLLHGVVKKLTDEGAVPLLAASGEISHVASPGKMHDLRVVGVELTAWIDRLVVVRRAPAADRIVLLEGKAVWIDHRVAADAGLVAGHFRDFFPHG